MHLDNYNEYVLQQLNVINDKIVGLNECTNFIQHDIDASPLGFIKGQTPYDKINMISSKYNNGITCASGDSFIVNNREISADIVDMEAYAIAKIAGIKLCQAYRKQFGDDFISLIK